MANRGKVNIRLFIQHVGTGEFICQDEQKQVNNSRLIALFTNNIQRDYELTGEITVWRAKKGAAAGGWIRGQQIKDMKLVLTEGETLFVLYDDGIDVIPGGVGTGAKGTNAVALGGYGGGAIIAMDEDGALDRVGGDGQGGDLIGKEAMGQGGTGYGGLVKDGEAGGGAGGHIKRRDLNSQVHVLSTTGQPEESAKSSHPHRAHLAKMWQKIHH